MEAVNRILVVCIGNICRSPTALGFFKDEFQKKNIACSVDSAGLAAMIDHEASLEVREIMLKDYQIDLSEHRAKQLTEEMVLRHDLILVMDLEQQHYIQSRYQFSCGKVYQLGKWQKKSIRDPYQQSRLVFEQNVSLINSCVKDWISRLWD